MIANEVNRIWREFRKGCVDTKIKGKNPEDCEECLYSAVGAMAKVGLTNREAALMILKARSFTIHDECEHYILAKIEELGE